MKYSEALTDHDLIAATDTSRVNEYIASGRRVYGATFEVGYDVLPYIVTKTFAVGHAEAAAIYAREYAARILPRGNDGRHPARVLSVRWTR